MIDMSCMEQSKLLRGGMASSKGLQQSLIVGYAAINCCRRRTNDSKVAYLVSGNAAVRPAPEQEALHSTLDCLPTVRLARGD